MESMQPRQWAVAATAMLFVGAIGYFGQARVRSGSDSKLQKTTYRKTGVERNSEIVIEVRGEVTKPGIYRLPKDSRLNDAILASGGFTGAAETQFINLAQVLKDGSRVDIPAKSSRITQPSVTETSGPEPTPSTPKSEIPSNDPIQTPSQDSPAQESPQVTAIKRVSINTGSVQELASLSQIGPSIAQNIVDYRERMGNFESLEDLMKVSGIGPKVFDRIKDYISL